MTTTENLGRQDPTCQCGCCGPTATTAVTEPPATPEKATAHSSGCDCGCTDKGCGCGCGAPAD